MRGHSPAKTQQVVAPPPAQRGVFLELPGAAPSWCCGAGGTCWVPDPRLPTTAAVRWEPELGCVGSPRSAPVESGAGGDREGEDGGGGGITEAGRKSRRWGEVDLSPPPGALLAPCTRPSPWWDWGVGGAFSNPRTGAPSPRAQGCPYNTSPRGMVAPGLQQLPAQCPRASIPSTSNHSIAPATIVPGVTPERGAVPWLPPPMGPAEEPLRAQH